MAFSPLSKDRSGPAHSSFVMPLPIRSHSHHHQQPPPPVRSRLRPIITRHHSDDIESAGAARMMINDNGTIPPIDADEQATPLESPNTWRRSRDKRLQTAPSKLKLRDRRRIREKRRSHGAQKQSEGTSSGEEDEAERCSNNHHTIADTNLTPVMQEKQTSHIPLSKRLSPAAALLGRFRGSKSQSDLDADCEDNTADYDSASMISASDMAAANASYPLGVHQHSSQFFIPTSTDACFQAHVQEIRVAGMQQLTVADEGPNTDDALSGTSSSDEILEENHAKILAKERKEKTTLINQLAQQEERITQLERIVTDLSKRLRESDVENQRLRTENQALRQAMQKMTSTS